MGTVLEDVLMLQRGREAAATEAYGKLVNQLASGAKPPSATSVDATLTAAAKSVDELAESVRLIQRRETLRAEIKQIDSRNDDRVGLFAKIETAKAELQAAQDRFKEVTFPIQREIDEISQLHHRKAECERELRGLVGEDDEAELAGLAYAIEQAANQKDGQIKLLRDLQSRLSSSDEGIRELAIGQVERAEEALAMMAAEVDDLVSQQSETLRIAVFG